MDRAKKKIVKNIKRIDESNYKLITRKFDQIFGLKKIKIKNIDSRKNYTTYIIHLHVQTHHYTQCTKYVLDLINNFQLKYKFMNLCFVKSTNLIQNEVQNEIQLQRKSKSKNERERERESDNQKESDYFNYFKNKDRWIGLRMNLYWNEFIDELTSNEPSFDIFMSKPDYSGVKGLLFNINEKNERRINEKLEILLKRKRTSLVDINDEIRVVLTKDTFNNYYSRQNFQNGCSLLRRKYPFIEIFHVERNIAIIRVWWKIYLHQTDNTIQLLEGGNLPYPNSNLTLYSPPTSSQPHPPYDINNSIIDPNIHVYPYMNQEMLTQMYDPQLLISNPIINEFTKNEPLINESLIGEFENKKCEIKNKKCKIKKQNKIKK